MSNNTSRLDGLIAPNLTPFNNDLSVAADLYVSHAQALLDQGCASLAPFGTTGEALSIGVDERKAGLASLVGSGIDPSQLMPGTGLTNIPDTVELTRHAMDLGCRAVLVLPPFYFKDPADNGVLAYFEALIESVGPSVRVFLYHIPQIAGVGFTPELVARIKTTFPDQVVGIKDSSGDWNNTRQLFQIDDLVVYPGSELALMDALALDGPGCISATANINAPAIIDVIDKHHSGASDVQASHDAVAARRLVFQGYAPIPAQKYLLAESSRDDRWLNVRPPLLSLSDEAGAELKADLSNLA